MYREQSRIMRVLLPVVVLMLAAPSWEPPLEAQYFGRNKVQYRTFDFQVLQTEHFEIYYYPEIEGPAQDVARMAERWYARLSRILNHEFVQRQPIILYAHAADFQQTNVLGGFIGEGTGGVTESAKQRIVMPLAATYAETDHVLGHELVHAFQYDISGLGRSRGAIGPGAQEMAMAPLWLLEGMAEYLSVGPVSPLTAMWLREAALNGDLPSIQRMSTDPRIFPYRYGHAVWAYVAGRWGDAVIGQVLRLVGEGMPYPSAFRQILNISLEELSDDWQASVRRTYLPMLTDRSKAGEVATPLVTRRQNGGRLNVAPVLSPDGEYIAFLSERDMDVDLWLADARTGAVIRRLQKGAAFDPHFSSLNFIHSAGTFSPDASRFAFAAQRNGGDVIAIVDTERGRRVADLPVDGVGAISNPAWAPDGRTIYFSGVRHGYSNLFALDVHSREVRQLTNDRYANLQPAVSPDGRKLAFVSDRGSQESWERMRFEPYRIHLLDLASGMITAAPHLPGKNINPVWTHDGTGLYFVSDANGIANLYRAELGSEEVFAITNLYGGVSGITDLSPTLTSAHSSAHVVFGAYEAGGYNLYALTDPQALAGEPVSYAELAEAYTSQSTPATLPPSPRPTEVAFNRVAAMLDDPDFGLPAADELDAGAPRSYTPRLTLDFVGQPQVGYSTADAFGRSGVSGGVAAIWSDMLGRHTFFGAVSANGQIDEIGFSSIYLYRRNRWNFGAGLQRLPLVFGYLAQGVDPADNMMKRQWVRARMFDSSLRGLAQYPISQVQRIEFSAGVRRFSSDLQIFEQVFDPDHGGIVSDGTRNEPVAGFNLVESSVALVFDSSIPGFTSPMAGQRYRFELSPTLGDVRFVQGLADYRRYVLLRPFTVAVRGLHFGRYGPDSDATDEQRWLSPDLYLGYPSLVRGYFDVHRECRLGQDDASCLMLDQLMGSRIGVVNAELRFPLLRYLVLGFGSSALPPVEGFAFFDAGVAWSRDTRIALQRGLPLGEDGEVNGGRRGIMTSAGIGARINVFGYFVLELDYLNAFERQRGWHWQFAIQPGF
jgi:Tol biopolymer transport system component